MYDSQFIAYLLLHYIVMNITICILNNFCAAPLLIILIWKNATKQQESSPDIARDIWMDSPGGGRPDGLSPDLILGDIYKVALISYPG